MKLIIIAVLLIACMSFANEDKTAKQINYNVIRNNEIIGSIQVSYTTKNDSIIYYLDSHINVKCLFRFDIRGKETSIFKNDTMIYSSVYRRINDKVKSNHNVLYKNMKYHEAVDVNNIIPMDLTRIQHNLVSLYFFEPKTVRQVYCAYLKAIVDVESLGNNKYKVELSNGKYNIFHYQNGVCIKIEAHSRIFSVVLVPDA
ncbi:DUF6134 family protein [Algibacter mikhailovii]|uniref:DUF6134 family protein n=1 Tax=Algibacter mikhailovii TaxID=425498 RepID=UPI0024955433|nr:DUF6134 family protein [Algibacter mikhailovii]